MSFSAHLCQTVPTDPRFSFSFVLDVVVFWGYRGLRNQSVTRLNCTKRHSVNKQLLEMECPLIGVVCRRDSDWAPGPVRRNRFSAVLTIMVIHNLLCLGIIAAFFYWYRRFIDEEQERFLGFDGVSTQTSTLSLNERDNTVLSLRLHVLDFD